MDNTTYKYASIYAPTDYSSPLVSNSNNGKGMAFLDFLGIGESFLNGLIGHYENNRQMHFQEDMQKSQMEFANEQRELTQQYNTSEREATQQFNLDMYNMNNAYNSPQAQMQRAMEAGINPNSFAQSINGGQSQAVTSSPQSVGMPGMPGMGNGGSHQVSIGGMFDKIVQAEMLDANKKLLDSQANKNNAEANALTSNAETNRGMLQLGEKQLDEVKRVNDKTIEHINKQIESIDSENELRATETEWNNFRNTVLAPIIEKQEWQKLSNMKAEYDATKAKTAALYAEAANLRQQIAESKERIKLIQSEAEKNKAQTELMNLEKKLKENEVTISNIRTEYYKNFGYDPTTTPVSNQLIIGGARMFSMVGQWIDSVSNALERFGSAAFGSSVQQNLQNSVNSLRYPMGIPSIANPSFGTGGIR